MRLAGEIALVTGGGGGIGAAVARAFAQAGAHLALAGRTRQKLEAVADGLQACGVKTIPYVCDVSDAQQVESLVGAVQAEFGGLDILVNCAGVYGPIGLLTENDMEAWARAIGVNLLGTAHTMHAVLPFMIVRRKGVIINFSGGGAASPFPRFSAYSASKAAVVRLTETVADEVREFGIRVNAIAPGAVNTRLLDEVLAAGERAGHEFWLRAQQQKESGGTPPERAAELAVFLASPAAAGITGRLISAVWDDWRSLPEQGEKLDGSALFTLRRIDGRQFREIR